jgi:hypothetical protein
MKRIGFLLIGVFFFVSPARAEVHIVEHILQKGLFVAADCKADSTDPSYDDCQCDADIRYPEITGLANNAVQQTLNENFKHSAEQVKCEGKQVDAPAKPAAKESQISTSSVSHHYEMTFLSPSVLGLRFTDWEYTGGAHGNGAVQGAIVDLEKGKLLTTADLIAAQNFAAVNQVIYNTLSAKPEGEVFKDQIESRKDSFINEKECQGCTLTLTPNGVQVMFQTYEVASFAEGNMEVTIPAQYISNAAVKQALASAPKTASLENK